MSSSKSQTTSLKYASVDGVDLYLEYVIPTKATKQDRAPIFLWFVRRLLEHPAIRLWVDVTLISAWRWSITGQQP